MKFFETSKYYQLNKPTYINLRWIAIIGQLFTINLVAFFFEFGSRGALNKLSKPGLPRFGCVAFLRPDARITKNIWICFGRICFEMCGIRFYYELNLSRMMIILLLV